jgi:uncharacterized coiled-coil protein SlyX
VAAQLEGGRAYRQQSMDNLQFELAAQRHDIERLDRSVQYCLGREDEVAESVTEAVFDHIAESGLRPTSISFLGGRLSPRYVLCKCAWWLACSGCDMSLLDRANSELNYMPLQKCCRHQNGSSVQPAVKAQRQKRKL